MYSGLCNCLESRLIRKGWGSTPPLSAILRVILAFFRAIPPINSLTKKKDKLRDGRSVRNAHNFKIRMIRIWYTSRSYKAEIARFKSCHPYQFKWKGNSSGDGHRLLIGWGIKLSGDRALFLPPFMSDL